MVEQLQSKSPCLQRHAPQRKRVAQWSRRFELSRDRWHDFICVRDNAPRRQRSQRPTPTTDCVPSKKCLAIVHEHEHTCIHTHNIYTHTPTAYGEKASTARQTHTTHTHACTLGYLLLRPRRPLCAGPCGAARGSQCGEPLVATAEQDMVTDHRLHLLEKNGWKLWHVNMSRPTQLVRMACTVGSVDRSSAPWEKNQGERRE